MNAPVKPAAPGAWDSAVGLVTKTHRADLDRCALLFESLDRYVPGRGTHYVIVDDADVAAFARFRRPDRPILPASRFLPGWLRPVPLLRWNGRRYWWSPHGRPLSGWHVQQIVKIEAARSLGEERLCLIDSDVCFFRDFDLTRIARPRPAPFLVHRGGVTAAHDRHIRWLANASRLLGIPARPIPADDYIDQIIVWDRDTVRAMTAHIEAVAGRNWVAALCRDRDFSEYTLYGNFVASTPAALARHAPTTQPFARTHWGADAVGVPEILAMLGAATEAERALCIQSFGATPVETIRDALDAFRAVGYGEPNFASA